MDDGANRGSGGLVGRQRNQPSGAGDFTSSPGGRDLYLRPHAIVITLLLVVTVLATSSLLLQLLHYGTGFEIRGMRMLNLERETNLPTWVSSINLAICALLLFFIGRAASDRSDPYAAHWMGLCLVFLYLSLDEAGNIHERASPLVQQFLSTSGALYPAWTIPALLAVAALALIYLRFLFALPTRTRWLFVLAAVLYVGGAAGLQLVVWHYRYPLFQANPDDLDASNTLTFTLLGQTEEVLEMVGVIVFMYGLLEYLAWQKVRVEISFSGGRPERTRRS